jgi:hypothetical protein
VAGGGTPHKPTILDNNGYALHEATMCASYLIGRGVPPPAIMKEISSYDTIGNAYFSLVIHAIPAGWRHIAVVTSKHCACSSRAAHSSMHAFNRRGCAVAGDFHMPRTQQLFTDIYGLATQDISTDDGGCVNWYWWCFESG